MTKTLSYSVFFIATTALVGCSGEGDPTAGPEELCVEMAGANGDLCVMEGEYFDNHTLTADQNYLLRGGVFIGDDSAETILTIEPGVTVYGDTAGVSFLTIRRGSKLMAEGTRDNPIVFTSAAEQRNRGDWGGIIINGQSTLNICGDTAATCTAEGEGGTGTYGGDIEDDNSGVLKWLRVEFAGKQLSVENELNGIGFQGVGSATTVDYVQSHMGADDGIEFFGGTVNAKHLLLTGAGDDSLDWTYGWRGMAQHIVIQQYNTGGDNGIEADNYDNLNTASPASEPTISNITLIGSPGNTDSDIGLLLREGTGGHLYNAVVLGFDEACLDISDGQTFTNASDGTLSIVNSIMWCSQSFKEEEGDEASVGDWYLGQSGNTIENPLLEDALNLSDPGFTPATGSPATSGAVMPSGSFFDTVSYRGGVDPASDWTTGWSTTATE